MNNNILNQIFTSRFFASHAFNQKIKTTAKKFMSHGYIQSRTLSNALQNTLDNYSEYANIYPYLFRMCALLTPYTDFQIRTHYNIISSEDADDVFENLIQYLNITPTTTSPTTLTIDFYHIPKGKSYLQKALDHTDTSTSERLTPIEIYCRENVYHFVRIYKNFYGQGPNTITIFSDTYSPKFINTLFVLLPRLLQIVPRETETSEEDKQYNQKVKLLDQFFTLLFDNTKSDIKSSIPDPEYDALITRLYAISTQYIDLFNLDDSLLNEFMTQLSTAQNRAATNYFTNRINGLNSDIRQYETTLTTKYQERNNYLRLLNAQKLIAPADVKPLIDTINNTKAIEILSVTNTELILKITAPVQYFQSEDFTAYENNPNSNYNMSFAQSPALKSILHKIFVTREYKLPLQGIVHLRVQDSYNNAPLYIFNEQNLNNTNYSYTELPNPHLYHHDCWSTAKVEMQKNTLAGNFELVVMQMVAAVQTVNVAEHASFVNGLLSDIKNTGSMRPLIHIIVPTEDGKERTLSLSDAITYEQNCMQKETLEKAAEKIAKNSNEYTQVEIPDDDWDDEDDNDYDEEDEDEED